MHAQNTLLVWGIEVTEGTGGVSYVVTVTQAYHATETRTSFTFQNTDGCIWAKRNLDSGTEWGTEVKHETAEIQIRVSLRQ